MNLTSRISHASIGIVAALGLATSTSPATAGATPAPAGPQLTVLTTFGTGLGSGSTIGPDGALYVTDGNAGSVVRIDRRTGATSTFADGLPQQRLGIGGPIDVAFIGPTAYVLVTLVGGDIVGGDPIGDDVVGIYRLGRDGRFSVVADIGAWSVDHPPTTDFFITTGVQYALEAHRAGFLVTDGHHNRVLSVTRRGVITELAAFGNVVPTGLATTGDDVYIAEAGPLPHRPDDGKVVALDRPTSTTTEVARGASMVVDVETTARRGLFALSQGAWDGVAEGSPAAPDTGRLLRVTPDGTFEPIVDGAGEEIVLDRPTSMEIAGGTAYIVSLTGVVYTLSDVAH